MANQDRFYGMQIKRCPAGRVGLCGFRMDGEDWFIIFFSIAQGLALTRRFATCFAEGEAAVVAQEVDDREYLPRVSPHEPIVVGGMAGTTLCMHYYVFCTATADGTEDMGYDALRPRIIAYLYSPSFGASWFGQKSTIIALKDTAGHYRVHVVFTDDEARRILTSPTGIKFDLAHYERLMELSPMSNSEPHATISIEGEHGEAAAREICLFLDVTRALCTHDSEPPAGSQTRRAD